MSFSVYVNGGRRCSLVMFCKALGGLLGCRIICRVVASDDQTMFLCPVYGMCCTTKDGCMNFELHSQRASSAHLGRETA